MCRFAAYLGPSLPLARFLLEPPHNLVEQSYRPREMRSALLNADGFGIGWYNGDIARTYRNPLPIWADPNLENLACSLQRPLWFCSVRSATEALSTGYANTQPFADDELMFLHNGFVDGFAHTLRPRIRSWLEPAVEIQVQGTTDSEYLFAVLRQLLNDQDTSIDLALRDLCNMVERWAPETPALLNIAVTDGVRIYALRHALNETCPSLYYTTDDETFPGAQLLASEALTDAGLWCAVPDHHLLILDPEEPPALLPL